MITRIARNNKTGRRYYYQRDKMRGCIWLCLVGPANGDNYPTRQETPERFAQLYTIESGSTTQLPKQEIDST